jgi:rod shape-determining protein MreC
LKGLGQTKCLVDYAQNEEKVDEGEWFYTSGDDRIFPRGFPVGQVTSVHNGKTFKEIYLVPSGFQGGVEEVLVMLQGKHLQIPDIETATPGYKILPAPPESTAEAPQPAGQQVLTTDADRLREQYKQSGEAQHHVFGEGLPGSIPPDFTKIPGIRASTPPANQPAGVPKPGAATTPATPGGAQPQRPPASQPGGTAVNVSPSPATPPGTPATNPANAPPKPKPRPTAPILVTDPTDADPDAVAPPAPKPDKPATPVKPPGVPPARPPSGNQ